jgi:hypothetical protein
MFVILCVCVCGVYVLQLAAAPLLHLLALSSAKLRCVIRPCSNCCRNGKTICVALQPVSLCVVYTNAPACMLFPQRAVNHTSLALHCSLLPDVQHPVSKPFMLLLPSRQCNGAALAVFLMPPSFVDCCKGGSLRPRHTCVPVVAQTHMFAWLAGYGIRSAAPSAQLLFPFALHSFSWHCQQQRAETALCVSCVLGRPFLFGAAGCMPVRHHVSQEQVTRLQRRSHTCGEAWGNVHACASAR